MPFCDGARHAHTAHVDLRPVGFHTRFRNDIRRLILLGYADIGAGYLKDDFSESFRAQGRFF